jgi:hypothetical protein
MTLPESLTGFSVPLLPNTVIRHAHLGGLQLKPRQGYEFVYRLQHLASSLSLRISGRRYGCYTFFEPSCFARLA